VPEELRTGRQERYEGWLVDVSPIRSESANYEVELVAEEAVVRVADQVDDQRQDGGRERHVSGGARAHALLHKV
jgi:hypothetical protein